MSADKQTCTDLMIRKMHELQRKPTFAEVEQDPQMPSANVYAFYWRSFGEAVDKIWSKTGFRQEVKLTVRKNIFDNGGQPASGGAQKVQKRIRPVVQPTKTVQVRAKDRAKLNANTNTHPRATVQPRPNKTTSGPKPNRGKRGREPFYTLEDLKAAIVLIQNYFKITEIPNQMQINQAAREIRTPAYKTFLSRLGPKVEWRQILNDVAMSEDGKASV